MHRAWERGEVGLIPTGLLWVAVEADLTPTFAAMERVGPSRLGPVLVLPEADRAWWLLPPGTEELLDDLPQLTVRPAGWVLRCPPADRYVDGLGWLEKPDGSGRLTHPETLGAAFGPGRGLPTSAPDPIAAVVLPVREARP